MKKFNIPEHYRSPIISVVKNARRDNDKRKQDFSPSTLDFGPVRFLIARHFGFCYGVENAIDICYRAIAENPNKRLFLLSEMIHNPAVNADLQERGIQFIMKTNGTQLIPWEEITAEDIVIVPAFGTTVEIMELLKTRGIQTISYDTTCPFVKKVWNRANSLGKKDYTIVVHGKPNHEETRATFSHSKEKSPTVVLKNMKEAHTLVKIIKGEIPYEDFFRLFANRYSEGFDPSRDLQRIGVVNQTTMLATETQAIAEYIREGIIARYGIENIQQHFADTRDTLCYATNDNQNATYGLLKKDADLAIVVGGYNSSNTSHIVELCEEKLPTYFISSANKILSSSLISHFDYHNSKELVTENFLSDKQPLTIILTSGASCPDALVDQVLQRILSFYPNTRSIEEVLAPFRN